MLADSHNCKTINILLQLCNKYIHIVRGCRGAVAQNVTVNETVMDSITTRGN